MKKYLVVIVLLISYKVLANYRYRAPHWIRSPKGLLMGDAFTAIADDEYTLFYNPAALARNRHEFSFTPFNPQITANNYLADSETFEDLPSEPADAAEVLMNHPAHVGLSLTPGIKLFNFGFNLITSEQLDLLMRNRVHPVLDIDYRSDRGFITGIAYSLNKTGGKEGGSGSATNVGLGVKYIKREGIFDQVSLTGTDVLNYLDSDSADIDELKEQLGVVKGSSWGFDFGIEHEINHGPHQMVFSLAALDLTDTTFTIEGANPDNRQVAPIEDQINFGTAYTYATPYFHVRSSLDIRALNEDIQLMQRVRAGIEVGLPGITALAGFNAGYYSYGAQLDLKLIKVMAGFYGVESGNMYKQIKAERMMIYLSLFDFSFDT